MPTYISKHFTLEEAIDSETALRFGIKNQPDIISWQNMQKAAIQLEKLREKTGPLIVSSWFRSYQVNKLVGGAINSAHMTGWAIDVKSPTLTPFQLCKIAEASGLEFDQIIHEFGSWMHISFHPDNRKQCLSIFEPATYLPGLIELKK